MGIHIYIYIYNESYDPRFQFYEHGPSATDQYRAESSALEVNQCMTADESSTKVQRMRAIKQVPLYQARRFYCCLYVTNQRKNPTRKLVTSVKAFAGGNHSTNSGNSVSFIMYDHGPLVII